MHETLKKLVIFALTLEARFVLWRFNPKIIAVTGSVGKATTKDAIYAALGNELYVRRSEKSFNSDLGVPLAILGLENAWRSPLQWALNLAYGLKVLVERKAYPAWLILEIGADRPGDIRRIARWLRPDIVVITGVPEIPVHVEYFRSPKELAREKRSLAEYVKTGGKLILNGDDARMVELCSEFRGMMIRYGLGKDNDFVGSREEIAYANGKPTGVRFSARGGSVLGGPSDKRGFFSVPLAIPGALGRPRIYAALAALAVSEVVGVDSVSSATALGGSLPPPGRMRIIPGVNGSTIIDDTYNSSPAAAHSALETLKRVKASRRIAILGDMLELGKYASDAHRTLGARAAESADMLITLGFRARAAAEAALDGGMADGNIRQYEYTEAKRAGRELRDQLKEGDVVLVKGSQSMRMERTVKELMQEPDQAHELLVRQDPEWLARK